MRAFESLVVRGVSREDVPVTGRPLVIAGGAWRLQDMAWVVNVVELSRGHVAATSLHGG